MVFSSVQFIFFFLPIALAVYFAAPWPARNAVLLVESLIFYMWGAGDLVSLLLISIAGNFFFGHAIGRARDAGNERKRNMLLAIDVVANLALLGYYKYANFAVDQIDIIFEKLGMDRFSVQLIPETQARTTLQGKGVGSRVNLEADMIGKYVARLFSLRQSPGSGLTEEALKAAGFGVKG